MKEFKGSLALPTPRLKQKTIVQVYGVANKGKSETIKIAKEELLIKYVNPSHTYTLPLPFKHDITELITLSNGIKIGIESMGDYLWYGPPGNRLCDRLDQLVLGLNCDVIVCASRMRNDVSQQIEYLSNTHGYRILKFSNFRDDHGHFNHHDLNKHSAKYLAQLVDDIMNGVI